MTFFPASPYTPHKATPQFVVVCFRFVQTAVFLLLSSLLRFKINQSRTFINAYNFVLERSIYIALENVELIPLLFIRFLENRA